MELMVELGKYTIEGGTVCKSAKFSLATRIDDCPAGMAGMGIHLERFLDPAFAEEKKVEYSNIPLLNEVFDIRLVGEGEGNWIPLGARRLSKAVVVVKKLDDQVVAILQLTLEDVNTSEELASWLFHNTGKVITVKMEKCQGELFGESARLKPVTDFVEKAKELKKKDGVSTSIIYKGKETKIA